MRIAVVHSFFSSSQPNGENTVVSNEVDALRRSGHDVRLVAAHTDEVSDEPGYSVRSALRVVTGRGRNPVKEIEQFQPEVVHVHNLFPNFAASWLRSLPIPFVRTLHSYRPFCAGVYYFRDGEVCRSCTEKSSWHAVRHRCYRGSALATAPMAFRTALGVERDPTFSHAARVIALNPVMRDELEAGGVDESRLTIWPNFLPDALDPGPGEGVPADPAEHGYLFVGRLSPEKGIVELLNAWPDNAELTIVGNGAQEEEVIELARQRPSVTFVGRQPRPEVLRLMRHARAMVLPSQWFEGFPLTYVEALACGLPVLATDPCSVAEQVVEDGTGIRFATIESLAQGIGGDLVDVLPSRAAVRHAFESRYTEARYVARAEQLYHEVRRG